MMAAHAHKVWMLVVAAGRGMRCGGDVPKQYQKIGTHAVLWHTIQACVAAQKVDAVAVVVAPDDEYFSKQDDWPQPLHLLRVGGATRANSVLAGLQALRSWAQDEDWVLVHDAARCGIRAAHIDAMIDALQDDPVGGLLAMPCVDTVKRGHGAPVHVQETLDREELWLAQTPQMFRYPMLLNALGAPHAMHCSDESSAIEALGFAPKIILGSADNFKITHPEDLERMAQLLSRRVAVGQTF